MRMAGTLGELTAGGRWVATLGIWTARLNDEGGVIKAALTEANAFWLHSLTQTNVALGVGKQLWTWRDAEIESVTDREIQLRVKERHG